MKDTSVQIRLSPQDKGVLLEKANQQRMGISTYIRSQIINLLDNE